MENVGYDLDAVIAQQAAQQQEPEPQQEQPEQQQEAAVQPQEESFQARNFKQLRSFTEKVKAEKEQLAKENEELRKYLLSLQTNNQPQQQQHASEPDEFDLGLDDEIAEKKDVKKVYQTAKQALKAQKQLEAQMYAMKA